MKISLIRKKNKIIFESKINKKSLYLHSLPRKKFESLEKIKESKKDLFTDKLFGLGEYERNYALFSPRNNMNSGDTQRNIILNQYNKSFLRNRINIFFQKENYKNYKTYEDYQFYEGKKKSDFT